MSRIDPSLARGYARAFINKQPLQSRVDAYADPTRRIVLLKQYNALCQVRPQGHRKQAAIFQRLLKPVYQFSRTSIDITGQPMVEATALGQAPENTVLDVTTQRDPRFSERALFLTTLVLFSPRQRTDLSTLSIYIGSNMSHHAVQRLLERGVATPDTLRAVTLEILKRTRHLGLLCTNDAEIMDDEASLLVPFPGGAAICTCSSVRPSETREDPLDIVSVRSVLSDKMLRPAQRAGFDRFEALYAEKTADADALVKWCKQNRLPAKNQLARIA